jgi:hypothetical protein
MGGSKADLKIGRAVTAVAVGILSLDVRRLAELIRLFP